MGYLNLNYDEYQANIDYWNGELGVTLPKWADEIAAHGESISAIDFYDDIFGDDLEEHMENPYEYQKGEYAAIALEIEYKRDEAGKPVSIGHRHTITRGQPELYDLIEHSNKFCAIAPVSYAGRTRHNKNARFLYALCVEIDNIQENGGINELIYTWERTNMKMPKPTYIVCSGTGLHLYLVFERPIPLFKNIFEQLTQIKKHLAEWWWYKPISASYDKIQYESICQPFRCVGTHGKDPHKIAMAFKTGEKWTIEKLNMLLPENLQLGVIYKSNLTKEQARELYPDWYKRRIEEGKPRKVFSRYAGIYHNWKQKMFQGAAVGARYNCLENLCSLAVQCNISPEEVEKDCREMAKYLETLTVEETNHFTEYDIECALSTYYRADEGAYRRRREYIASRTGIALPENKRNHRPQLVHMKRITALRDADYPDGSWRNLNGRPYNSGTAEGKVLQWRRANPEGTKADCHRDTGLDPKTIRKWWETKKTLDFFYALLDEENQREKLEEARKQHRARMKAYLDSLSPEAEERTSIEAELARYDEEDRIKEEKEKEFQAFLDTLKDI